MKRTWKENKNWKTARSQETSIDEEHLGDKQTREEIVHKILAKQTNKPVPVVRRVDNALHRINLYPVDSAVSFVNTYPLDSVIRPLYIWALVFPQSFQSCCEYSYIKLNWLIVS